jgi:cyanate permease
MAAALFGVHVLGRVMGIVLAADGVGEAVAPWLVGRMRDAAGSYASGFVALIGCALVGAVAIVFLPRGSSPPVPLESSPPVPLSLRERGNQ